jgi:hypothetical protein
MKIELCELIEARDALKDFVAAAQTVNGVEYNKLVKPMMKASSTIGMLNFYIWEASKNIKVEVTQ